jgi:hypothetical protein
MFSSRYLELNPSEELGRMMPSAPCGKLSTDFDKSHGHEGTKGGKKNPF